MTTSLVVLHIFVPWWLSNYFFCALVIVYLEWIMKAKSPTVGNWFWDFISVNVLALHPAFYLQAVKACLKITHTANAKQETFSSDNDNKVSAAIEFAKWLRSLFDAALNLLQKKSGISRKGTNDHKPLMGYTINLIPY